MKIIHKLWVTWFEMMLFLYNFELNTTVIFFEKIKMGSSVLSPPPPPPPVKMTVKPFSYTISNHTSYIHKMSPGYDHNVNNPDEFY